MLVGARARVQLWVSASAATKNVFFTTIQPILDSYRPPGVTALGFRKVSLGTIPPKVRLLILALWRPKEGWRCST